MKKLMICLLLTALAGCAAPTQKAEKPTETQTEEQKGSSEEATAETENSDQPSDELETVTVSEVLSDPAAWYGKTFILEGSLPQALMPDLDGNFVPYIVAYEDDMPDSDKRIRISGPEIAGTTIVALTGTLKVGPDDAPEFDYTSGTILKDLAPKPD